MNTPLDLETVYKDDAMLKRVFSWLSRIGAGPKFGSRPIGWYQSHQCAAIDVLLEMGIRNPVCQDGIIRQKGQHGHYIFVADVFSKADAKCRQ